MSELEIFIQNPIKIDTEEYIEGTIKGYIEYRIKQDITDEVVRKLSRLREQNKVLLECAEFYDNNKPVVSEGVEMCNLTYCADEGNTANKAIKKYKEIGSGE